MVSPARQLDLLHADLTVLAAIPDHQLDTPVPTCPGFTITDLLAHLGRVHHRAISLFEGAPFAPLVEWEPTPVGAEAVAWSRQVGAELEATARRVGPDAPTHCWLGEVPASFWIRRMTQETSVHRWDAEHALGDPSPIAADLGADGVDEALTRFVPMVPAERWAELLADDPGRGDATAPRTIHLHATDTDGEWMITLDAHGVTVTAEHGKGDVAVRGGGSALDLLVWNRITADEQDLTCFGDRALLDRFLTATRF